MVRNSICYIGYMGWEPQSSQGKLKKIGIFEVLELLCLNVEILRLRDSIYIIHVCIIIYHLFTIDLIVGLHGFALRPRLEDENVFGL